MMIQKILKVNLTLDSYELVQTPENELSADKGFHHQISQWLRNFAEQEQVHLDNKDVFLRLTDLENLRNHFRTGHDRYVLRYERKVGDEYKQAVMELKKSDKYRNDSELVYLYVNID